MSYRIEFTPSAAKALAKVPQPDRGRIAKRIDGLAKDPRPRSAKKLEAKGQLYRIRVGDWRVVYQVQDDALIVLVIRIGDRKDVYRHLP
jgi:mRNA interferase RelE/StbE